MTTPRLVRRAILGAAMLAMTLSACTTEEDIMEYEQEVEQIAADARADIDALAAQVGTNPEVVQDEIGGCGPGSGDSGNSLSYIVHVTVENTLNTLDQLREEISDQLAADGWTVKPSPTGNPGTGEGVSFQKGPTTMGASIFMNKQYAAVSGSGGCLEKP